MRPSRRLLGPAVALLLAGGLIAGACSDDSGPEPTVVFGQGELPDSFPAEFPLPDGAVVGSTLVDGINVRTEVEFRLRGTVPDFVDLYMIALPNAGFEVDASVEEPTRWTIRFHDGDVSGSITLTQRDPTIASMVVEVDTA